MYGNIIILEVIIILYLLLIYISWEKDKKMIYLDGRKFVFDSLIEDGI